MRYLATINSFVLPTVCLSVCMASIPVERKITEEAQAFMSGYASELRSGNREALIDRYHPNGHFLVGQGQKELVTQTANRKFYMKEWNPMVSFTWRDLSYEPVSQDAIVVVGLFDWGTSANKTTTFSYTALLLRVKEKLKLRLEDESMQLPTLPSQIPTDKSTK